MNKTKKIIAVVAVIVGSFTLTANSCAPQSNDQYKEVEKKAAGMEPYIPKNNVELENYNRAQKLYDDPAAIQWCTLFPPSDTAPIVTTPIAGKLTTSATSYFSPTEQAGDSSGGYLNVPKRSVDGLFHGDSFYRYGFTPGGDYVDFSNSAHVRCSTALTEFQRQNTFVEFTNTEGDIEGRQKQAEAALKSGDHQKAEDILKGGK